MASLTLRYIVGALASDGITILCSALSKTTDVALTLFDVTQTLMALRAVRCIRPGALFQFKHEHFYHRTTKSHGQGQTLVVRALTPDDIFIVMSELQHVEYCTKSRTSCVMLACPFSVCDQQGRHLELSCDVLRHVRFIDKATER